MKNKTIIIVLLLCAGVILLFLYKNNLKAVNKPPISENTATTTPNGTLHYQNKYLGINLDYPSDLYADGSDKAFQITYIAPDDPKRASSASMGALAFSLKEDQTIEEYAEILKPLTLSSKDLLIGNHRAKEIISLPDGYSGSTWVYILVETKKGALMISFLRDTDKAQIYRSIIDSIGFE